MWHLDVKYNTETFKKNYRLYLMEALGLAIFMCSCCFFAGQLWHQGAFLNIHFPTSMGKNLVMGLAMSLTAIIIFYSPLTAPSGSHINPAVSLVQYYLGNLSRLNCFFYIISQFTGGVLAVYIMGFLMKHTLTDAPVNYVVTVPGKGISNWKAAICEIGIGFIMITMVLHVSNSGLKKFTKIFAALLVYIYVVLAGPVSGFGMNPARSFATAFPSGIYTAFWIYMLCPIVGMMSAAILFKRLSASKIKIKKYDSD
ncbi:aquaporin [Parasediminibacterium paludis]|uniref:Aquaporin n=1 Tax=Parasediminibacterium paludis TaxID=908966 RepID=A0ABV8PYF4_9BACT